MNAVLQFCLLYLEKLRSVQWVDVLCTFISFVLNFKVASGAQDGDL